MTLFSFFFGALFSAFIVAAIVGHYLVLREFARPFTEAAAKRPVLPSASLQPGF